MLKLIMIGALGTMLGPSSEHLKNNPEIKVLRVLDRGSKNDQANQFRSAWKEYGAELVSDLDDLISSGIAFDGIVICAGKNGDDFELIQYLVPKLTPQTFILQLSTVSCDFVIKTNQYCQQYKIDYANYPVTGGMIGAKNASMLIMASGSKNLYQRVQALLNSIGKPYYLDERIETAAATKLLNHILVFYGLVGSINATSLQARLQDQNHFSTSQVALFDFLNQGSGGTRQWEVALRNGIAHEEWKKGFLLKHAAIDLIYLLQLMIENQQFLSGVVFLLELAFSFAFLLQEGLENYATQVLGLYWLIPEKKQKLSDFLTTYFDPLIGVKKNLEYCLELLPEKFKKSAMLFVKYD